jgi:Collagen triple helix repeat (20 copies)
MKKLVYISTTIFLLCLLNACKKGEIGEIGPAGAKGATGDAGVNNTTAGATGLQGATGNKGATGSVGLPGPTGADGINNLVITDWKKATYQHLSTSNGKNFYEGEVLFPEITQAVLDKGFISAYLRINKNSAQTIELEEGAVVTISSGSVNMTINNVVFALGKVKIQSSENTTVRSAESFLNFANSNTAEIRISIIKGI